MSSVSLTTRTLWLAILAFVAALTVLIVSYQLRPATAFSTKVSINVDKNQREFLLIESPPPNSGSALLIAFHGAGDFPEKLLRDSRLDQLTTETALVLACPFSHGERWNTSMHSDTENPDILFVDALIAKICAENEIDEQRIYLMGMSNGASFAQLYAMNRIDRIAAVVAHSGPVPNSDESNYKSVPTMMICGLRDTFLTDMKHDEQRYTQAGTMTEFVTVPQLGHQWSQNHTPKAWEFLRTKSLGPR